MSKQNLEKTLRSELEVLNDQIDEKIIKGLSYIREAKRHKFILCSLKGLDNEINREVNSGWFGRPLSLSNVFIF